MQINNFRCRSGEWFVKGENRSFNTGGWNNRFKTEARTEGITHQQKYAGRELRECPAKSEFVIPPEYKSSFRLHIHGTVKVTVFVPFKNGFSAAPW